MLTMRHYVSYCLYALMFKSLYRVWKMLCLCCAVYLGFTSEKLEE